MAMQQASPLVQLAPAVRQPLRALQEAVVGCEVSQGPSSIAVPIHTGAAKVKDVFDMVNSVSPSGYTPTAEALRQAYDYYTKGDGHCLPGSKWVLLVTNGGANCNSSLNCGECLPIPGTGCYNDGTVCNDDAAVVSAINDLVAANVKTFVVGMPGNDAETASPDAYANAGRMPNVNGLNGNAH